MSKLVRLACVKTNLSLRNHTVLLGFAPACLSFAHVSLHLDQLSQPAQNAHSSTISSNPAASLTPFLHSSPQLSLLNSLPQIFLISLGPATTFFLHCSY